MSCSVNILKVAHPDDELTEQTLTSSTLVSGWVSHPTESEPERHMGTLYLFSNPQPLTYALLGIFE